MRVLLGILMCCGLVACGSDEGLVRWDSESTVRVSEDVRFSWPTPHQVLAEHRTDDGWSDPVVVFEDEGRECGRVHPVTAGRVLAVTLLCDEHFAEDQAPTASVAAISTAPGTWTHHDLEGESYLRPGLSPDGSRAVWVQEDELLTWHDGEFGSAPLPDEPAQVVTVEDDGAVLTVAPGQDSGRCTVELHSADARATVFVADAEQLLCEEIGLSLASATEVHGDVSGQPGTEFVVRRQDAGSWTLLAPPPLAAPGLATYPDDPDVAVLNQVAANTDGDLVAVGSPDRQHVTTQRYDAAQRRWTPPETVHDAGAPVCRRDDLDSGLLQGASFELRLMCGGQPLVLRSRTGEEWTTDGG